MGFNQEDLALIKEEFRRKNLRAKDEATQRLNELKANIPGFREIENGFADIGQGMLSCALDATLNEEGKAARLAQLDAQRQELSERRDKLLTAHGYPLDYTAPRYACKRCNDTGFAGVYMCDCMRRELVKKGYESSGLGGLIDTQNFESFSLRYYQEGEQRDNMARVLSACRKYADEFDPASSGNVLFTGGTGLGKTHLSTSIAKVVIEGGNNVVYESAQNIFNDFEAEHYGRRAERGELTGKYLECDLLIIDDLGTEMPTNFNISCLYNLVNTRLNRRLPMVINSNITEPAEFSKRYTDRISSRFFGEFKVFRIVGRDIRSLKLLGSK
ncbi:MAG: ATP-binding protein [Clostridia bacterium]|nr:ATP-binding protein [Clostridia bacterium]